MDLESYSKFISNYISNPSNDLLSFEEKLQDLDKNINVSLLVTGSLGLSSETGEFNEIVKKILFQGKPLNQENIYHMKRELGDILWYWVNSCRALGISPTEVMIENVEKLKNRYPVGAFRTSDSEIRHKKDL
jgi:NTP pyrophosphatase (non-canonical NTP hydrolase)